MGDSSHLFDDSLMGGDLVTQLDVKEHMQTKEQNAREERTFQNTVKIINRASNVKTKSYDQELRTLRKNMFDLHATTPSLHSVALLREGSKIFSMSRIIDRSHKISRSNVACGTLYGNTSRKGERRNQAIAPRAGSLPPLETGSSRNLSRDKNSKRIKGKEHRPYLSPVGSDDIPRDDLIYYDKDVIETSKLLKKNTKIQLTKALWVTNNLHSLYKKRYNLYVKLPPLKQNSFHNSRLPLMYKNTSFIQNGGDENQFGSEPKKKITSDEQNIENEHTGITLLQDDNNVDSMETIHKPKNTPPKVQKSKDENQSFDSNAPPQSTDKSVTTKVCNGNSENMNNNRTHPNSDESHKKIRTGKDKMDTAIKPLPNQGEGNKAHDEKVLSQSNQNKPQVEQSDLNEENLATSDDESNDGENTQLENVSALLTMSLK